MGDSPVCTQSWTVPLFSSWMRSVMDWSSLEDWTSFIQQPSRGQGDRDVSFDICARPRVEVNLPESLRLLLLQGPSKGAAGPCQMGWARHKHISSRQEPEGRKTHQTAKLKLQLLPILFLCLFISIGACWLQQETRAQSTEEMRKWKRAGPFFQLQAGQQTVYAAVTSVLRTAWPQNKQPYRSSKEKFSIWNKRWKMKIHAVIQTKLFTSKYKLGPGFYCGNWWCFVQKGHFLQ